VKDPQAAIGPALHPGFLVRSAMHPNRPGRNTSRQVETRAARFLGVARLDVAGVATTTGAIIVAVVRIQAHVDLCEQIVVVLVGRNAHGIGGIIHPCLLAGAVFTGVAQAEEMADLLAHDMPLLIRIGPI